MNKIIRKLSSQAGESIGETLVALLISALALVMLAGAISTGMRIVTTSKEKLDVYYKVNNAVVARATAAPTIDGTAAAGFSTGTLSVVISNLLPREKPNPEAKYWMNEELSGVQVIAYTAISTAAPAATATPGS